MKVRQQCVIALIFVMGVGFSLFGYRMALQWENSRRELFFESAAKEEIKALQEAIKDDLDYLDSIKGFYNASTFVDRHEFQIFTQDILARNRTIQALEWIPRVRLEEVPKYVNLAKADGYNNFQILEKDKVGKMKAVGVRKEYFPVYYVEPMLGNENAFGFDLASNKARKDSLTMARDTGEMKATASITLVQEEKNQKGFLVFNPIYKDNSWNTTVEDRREMLVGFVLGVYSVKDLVDGSLIRLKTTDLKFFVYELFENNEKNLLYIHGEKNEGHLKDEINERKVEDSRYLKYGQIIDVAGKKWEVVAQPLNNTFGKKTSQPILVLVICLMITIFLVGFTFSNMRKTADIEKLVKLRTRELMEAKQSLEKNKVKIESALTYAEKTKLALQNVMEDLEAERVKLASSEERFAIANFSAKVGIWDWDVVNNHIIWDKAMYGLYGIKEGDFGGAIEAWEAGLHPEDAKRCQVEIQAALKGEKNFDTDFRIVWPEDKSIHHIRAHATVQRDEKGEAIRMLGTNWDITELKSLAQRLASSNQELEQFAYVASHDLQEPIRKIVGFTQLFSNLFEGEMDGKKKEYMHYIVDGAKRMQLLIQDLLQYSRVGSTQLDFEEFDFTSIVEEAKANLELIIDETDTKITYKQLPSLKVHRGFMVRLIQNLINNSIKYRSEAPPEINILAELKNRRWEFTISDNGIGIAEEFFEQVFVVFKRLHGKGEYSGTGIGLAICRRIVERHGGRIWIKKSMSSKGTTFKFYLPE